MTHGGTLLQIVVVEAQPASQPIEYLAVGLFMLKGNHGGELPVHNCSSRSHAT